MTAQIDNTTQPEDEGRYTRDRLAFESDYLDWSETDRQLTTDGMLPSPDDMLAVLADGGPEKIASPVEQSLKDDWGTEWQTRLAQMYAVLANGTARRWRGHWIVNAIVLEAKFTGDGGLLVGLRGAGSPSRNEDIRHVPSVSPGAVWRQFRHVARSDRTSVLADSLQDALEFGEHKTIPYQDVPEAELVDGWPPRTARWEAHVFSDDRGDWYLTADGSLLLAWRPRFGGDAEAGARLSLQEPDMEVVLAPRCRRSLKNRWGRRWWEEAVNEMLWLSDHGHWHARDNGGGEMRSLLSRASFGVDGKVSLSVTGAPEEELNEGTDSNDEKHLRVNVFHLGVVERHCEAIGKETRKSIRNTIDWTVARIKEPGADALDMKPRTFPADGHVRAIEGVWELHRGDWLISLAADHETLLDIRHLSEPPSRPGRAADDPALLASTFHVPAAGKVSSRLGQAEFHCGVNRHDIVRAVPALADKKGGGVGWPLVVPFPADGPVRAHVLAAAPTAAVWTTPDSRWVWKAVSVPPEPVTQPRPPRSVELGPTAAVAMIGLDTEPIVDQFTVAVTQGGRPKKVTADIPWATGGILEIDCWESTHGGHTWWWTTNCEEGPGILLWVEPERSNESE